ncbi:PolC-type DNA polymerase III [Thermoactinomyces sp. CICC 23799]|uniref:PolC-type DNA polymerase III n=1 Tax=Thermoactinomyces sp. CICC 23799 TaxID=2767429 RepID=UPI0018DD63F2|nr:PolC-type DNA polymerase III [Thermoactinomyces sp. CICC 23799]MBH8600867.1 PolC-type DNA polymerase III [Thermoactinomyces sp. CICC 23799]
MKGRQALVNLFHEAELPEEWLNHAFRDGVIKEVQVRLQDRTWNIHLHLVEPMDAELWQDFQMRVKKHFQPWVRVNMYFTYDRLQHEIVLQKYKYFIQKCLQEQVTPAAATWFGQAEWRVEGDRIVVVFPNPAVLKMAKQRETDRYIMKYYERITGTKLPVILSAKETEPEQAAEQFREQRIQEEKTLMQKALAEQKERAKKQKEKSEHPEEPVVSKKLGYSIKGEPVKINDIVEEERNVVIKGKVFKSELKELKSGRKLLTFNLTDFTNSISCKVFARDKEQAAVLAMIQDGDWLKVRGSVQYDTFSRELVVMVNSLEETEPDSFVRRDTAAEKRVELHLHTSMSAMDGIASAGKMIQRAAEWGHPAVAITDHAVAQAYPEAYKAAGEHDIKVIYGVEANIVDDGIPIVMNEVEMDLLEGTYVVFDVETTGLSAVHDVIIELAAVKMKDGKIIDKFSSFANPHRPLSKHIVELTHITDDMLKDAPEVDDVVADFLEFIEGTVLVAHNARFDMGFLQEAVKRIGKEPVKNPVLDTLELARMLFPDMRNHRLNTLSDKLGIKLEQHHRAIYDAEATGHVMWKMLQIAVEKKKITHLHMLNENRGERDLKRVRPFHAILLVQNQEGMKNLYKLISMSHLKYFYRVPRIPRSELVKHRNGLLVGSGCERGELFEAALNKSPSEVEEIARFYDYLEIQPVEYNMHLVEKGLVENEERLRQANQLIVEIGEKLGKPVVATSNAHYLDEQDAIFREIIAANQTGAKPQGPLPKAHFRTTDEMLREFQYLGEKKCKEVVVDHPRAIAEQIEVVKPFPDETYTPHLEGAEEELKRICYQTAHEWYGEELPEIVKNRLERELNSIIKHGFSVLYMISQKIVSKSLEDGYLVGSRGSVGSSVVACLSYISEVNPLPPHYRCKKCKYSEFITDGSYESGFDLPDKKCPRCGEELWKDGHDIPFETFLGFEGDKAPDIDLNFDGEYQLRSHQYTEELFGKEYIYRAGSINTVKEKTAFGYVKKYAEQHNLNLRRAEIERLAQGCVGVKRSTGQHPGGLMVVPQEREVYDFTPIQHPADDTKSGVITTHFDYKAISGKILKLDLLGHTGPTIQRLLHKLTGVDPTKVPLGDPKVIELFRSTKSIGVRPEDINGIEHGTLGIPEFGTYFARGILQDAKPSCFSELVRVSGLSHGTDVWQGNVQDLINDGVCTISEAICCRDDIMLYLIRMGLPSKAAFKIMEKVRKGKGVSDEEEALMKEHGVPDWYIECCRKIKYMFPRAHAAAYVTAAVRIGWFKVYHPEAFYAALFSTRVNEFDIELVLKGYDAVKRKLNEINEMGFQASAKDKAMAATLELVMEMYARGIEFAPVDLYQSDAVKFWLDDQKRLIPPFASISGVGESAAQNIVQAREQGEFLSIEDLQKRARLSSTVIEVLERLGCLQGLPESNQLALF